MENIRCNRCETENRATSKYCSGCGYELPKIVIENEENQPDKDRKKEKNQKNKKVVTILAVIMGLVVSFSIQNLIFKKPSFDKVMIEAMNIINKSCPMMLDAETRLDNTSVIYPNTFQYNYTLISTEAGMIDTLALKAVLEPNIINFTKTSPQMKTIRDNNSILNYLYKDKNGYYLFMIQVLPTQYK